MSARNRSRRKENTRGFALLLLMLAILAILGVIALNKIGGALVGSQRQVAQAQASNDVLVAAKAALLGYVVQKIDGGTGYRLGNLPTPDILNGAGTAIQYDGNSDGNRCLSTGANGLPGLTGGTTSRKPNQRCLGKFPWRDLGLNVGNPDVNDPLGQVPWLVVSPNLNYWDQCLSILNSDTLNWTVSGGTSCPATPNTLPYPWMTVYDQSSTIPLSNRVAVVLIMPGSPIQTGGRTQSRTQSNPGFPGDYLDAISVPLGCTTTCVATFDNANLSNSFIQIAAGTRYPANSENAALAGQPITFNDVLIYITIDELMVAVERRVLSEMKASLINYYKTAGIGKYPWVAPFVSPVNISSFNSSAPASFGLFPLTVVPLTGTSAPAVTTDFDWSIAGATLSKKCVGIGAGQYIDQREFIIGSFKDGVASGATATCTWQVNGPSAVACDYVSTALPSVTKIFSVYNNAACSGGIVGTSTNNLAPTKVLLTVDTECSSATISYLAPTASDFSRWDWLCPTVKAGTTFTVDVSYSVTNLGGMTVGTSETATINGQTRLASLKRMRYQPLMPYWFYSNDWYLSAFAAVSPTDTPSPVVPCGSATKLTSGASANVAALVMLAGSRLPNLPAAPLQTRPSSVLSDYLELPNRTADTSCNFAASGATVSSTTNDQVLVVAP